MMLVSFYEKPVAYISTIRRQISCVNGNQSQERETDLNDRPAVAGNEEKVE